LDQDIKPNCARVKEYIPFKIKIIVSTPSCKIMKRSKSETDTSSFKVNKKHDAKMADLYKCSMIHHQCSIRPSSCSSGSSSQSEKPVVHCSSRPSLVLNRSREAHHFVNAEQCSPPKETKRKCQKITILETNEGFEVDYNGHLTNYQGVACDVAKNIPDERIIFFIYGRPYTGMDLKHLTNFINTKQKIEKEIVNKRMSRKLKAFRNKTNQQIKAIKDYKNNKAKLPKITSRKCK